jgi:hypothetical protein
MKAKCPFCYGGINSDCKNCKNTGTTDVKFAEGNLWTRKCLNPECGQENGGRITRGNEEPKEPSMECPWCNGPTKWVLLGNMNEIEQE